MRRTVAVVACLVAILGVLAPAAFAQTPAPAPKVTIVGLFDQITSAGANFYDGNYSRRGDHEWYARTRFRPDFTFEVGRTKAVLGLEFDITYGQTGGCGGGPGKATVPAAGSPICPGEKAGSTASSGLNTDVTGIVEIKWMYTEFDLTGKDALLPFIPVRTVARAGLQPFATLGNYRITYANGDFPGISAITTWAPNLQTDIAFVVIEDQLAGFSRAGSGSISPNSNTTGLGSRPTRGDDFAVILSPEFTPFKGLDIKPVFSYAFFQGTTSSQARRAVANITTPSAFGAGIAAGDGSVAGAAAYQNPNTGGPRYANGDPSNHENRYTIGLDARWRSGPFSFDPTIFYQWGHRSNIVLDNPGGGAYRAHSVEADMSSWLVDIQGGWQLGPLLLEVRPIYSTGNKARDNIGRSIKYFEPLDLDTSYYINWAQIFALGVDYFNGNGGQNGGMATNIGYDRYGRAQLGVRATYSLTPELALWGNFSPTWTAEKVDTDTTISAAGLRVCSSVRDIGPVCQVKGDHRYLGTEVDLGTTWRFAPNTAFDLVGAYLFAGSALDTRQCVNATGGGAPTTGLGGPCHKEDAHDAWTVAARVRMSF